MQAGMFSANLALEWIMSLILMSFCSCQHRPNRLNLGFNKTRSACIGQFRRLSA
jgi:hypothetical protein